jgi:hypothetical protein
MDETRMQTEVGHNIARSIRLGIMIVVGIVLFVIVGGFVVMWLWNWLLPVLFGWPEVTFWQALGILALSRILFGGFGSHGSGGRSWRRHKHKDHLTPEERERLRQGLEATPSQHPAE